jgi:hypothetical protein
MMSIRKARSLKDTVKSLGGGPKCNCGAVGFLQRCVKCYRMACANHYFFTYKTCSSCEVLTSSHYDSDYDEAMAFRWGGC